MTCKVLSPYPISPIVLRKILFVQRIGNDAGVLFVSLVCRLAHAMQHGYYHNEPSS